MVMRVVMSLRMHSRNDNDRDFFLSLRKVFVHSQNENKRERKVKSREMTMDAVWGQESLVAQLAVIAHSPKPQRRM